MSDAEKHLSPEQIERLAGTQPVTVEALAHEESGEDARRHLAACEACQKLVFMHGEFDRRLRSLREAGGAERGSNCPAETELWELACGVLPAGRVERVLEHVTTCDFCGPILRHAAADFDDAMSPQEQGVLAELESSKGPWREKLAATLSQESDRSDIGRDFKAPRFLSWRSMFGSSHWFLGASAVLILAFATFWLLQGRTPGEANRLIARAYSEQRTMELRIPEAKFAPIQVQRGTEISHLKRPPSLLEAEAKVARNLAEHPSDPFWLQAKARADLLEWNYDSALESLQRALGLQPNSPSLQLDMATAYVERADSNERALDYGTAIELMGRVLAKTPNDPIALFNRAITYEKMFMYREAAKDWEHYLTVGDQADWQEEAKKRLEKVRRILNDHDRGLSLPLLNPSEFLERVSRSDHQTWQTVDLRIERYLDEAVQNWLPNAFEAAGREKRGNPDDRSEDALFTLAAILTARHHDEWLSDILASKNSPTLAIAIQELANAVRENIHGSPIAAAADARHAETLFRRSANRPGLLRAQVEEVYALHRAFHGVECLRLARLLEEELKFVRYSWIETQLRLEQFSCSASLAQFDRGRAAITSASRLADSAEYETLSLRALGFEAVLETDKGNPVGAWTLDREGLRKYWMGFSPPLRAYQFYDDLSFSIQESGQWHLLTALGREAVAEISATPNRSGEAMARFQLAKSATQIGEWNEATDQFSKSSQLFASLPQDEATRTFEADAEVGLAEAEAQSGNLPRGRVSPECSAAKADPRLCIYDAT